MEIGLVRDAVEPPTWRRATWVALVATACALVVARSAYVSMTPVRVKLIAAPIDGSNGQIAVAVRPRGTLETPVVTGGAPHVWLAPPPVPLDPLRLVRRATSIH